MIYSSPSRATRIVKTKKCSILTKLAGIGLNASIAHEIVNSGGNQA